MSSGSLQNVQPRRFRLWEIVVAQGFAAVQLDLADNGIFQYIHDLGGCFPPDFVIQSAGAEAVTQHGVGAVRYISSAAKPRQLGTDGLAVKVIVR